MPRRALAYNNLVNDSSMIMPRMRKSIYTTSTIEEQLEALDAKINEAISNIV